MQANVVKTAKTDSCGFERMDGSFYRIRHHLSIKKGPLSIVEYKPYPQASRNGWSVRSDCLVFVRKSIDFSPDVDFAADQHESSVV